MKRRTGPPLPPKTVRRTTVGTRTRHSTVPRSRPPVTKKPALAKQPRRQPPPRVQRPPKRLVAHIIDEDATLLDVLDNLLSKGVVLHADVILALANVDLVYLRLTALLCAADRVLGR